MSKNMVTPEYCLGMTKPADTFLCAIDANTVGIRFLNFKIRDIETGSIIFDTDDQPPVEVDPNNLDALRTIRYEFDESMLKKKQIGTSFVQVFLYESILLLPFTYN